MSDASGPFVEQDPPPVDSVEGSSYHSKETDAELSGRDAAMNFAATPTHWRMTTLTETI